MTTIWPSTGWRYEGPLCMYKQCEVDGHDTGAMWECPFLVPLAARPSMAPADEVDGRPEPGGTASGAESVQPADSGSAAADTQTHVLCISPYPHCGPSTNSCLYWLGHYHDGRYDIDAAEGAHSCLPPVATYPFQQTAQLTSSIEILVAAYPDVCLNH